MYIILRLFDAGTLVWTIDSQRHCFFGLDEYGLKLSLGHLKIHQQNTFGFTQMYFAGES